MIACGTAYMWNHQDQITRGVIFGGFSFGQIKFESSSDHAQAISDGKLRNMQTYESWKRAEYLDQKKKLKETQKARGAGGKESVVVEELPEDFFLQEECLGDIDEKGRLHKFKTLPKEQQYWRLVQKEPGRLCAWLNLKDCMSLRNLSRDNIDMLKILRESVSCHRDELGLGIESLLFYVKYHPTEWRLHVHIHPESKEEGMGGLFHVEDIVSKLMENSSFFKESILPCFANSDGVGLAVREVDYNHDDYSHDDVDDEVDCSCA
jgi:hypothetical protein